MKRFFTLLIGVFAISAAPVLAQQDATATFTLQQAIDYAVQHSILSQNSAIDQRIAAAKVKETIGQGLPQISATGSLIHNPKLPRFFGTYTGPGGFIDFSGVPGIQVGDVVAAQNFFQLKSSGGLSATVNQLIFNGSYFVGLQATKTYKDLSAKAANIVKEQIIIQTTKAFYGVVINKERADLFTANINRVDTLLKNTRAQNKNGFVEEIDVDRIQVNLNNLIVDRDKFLNQAELAVEQLKYVMNYPGDQTLAVSGTIQELQLSAAPEAMTKDWDYKVRPDYQVLETRKKAQELIIKNKYATGLPSMNAFATYGYSTQSPTISGLFRTTSEVRDNGAVGPDKWYDYSQIGINLNIPIFSGGQRHYQVQQEKLRLLKINNGYDSLKNGINLEVKRASVSFDNSLKSLTAQKANMDLASKVARVTKIKYEQGVGSNIEVVDAENSLRTAQTNYYNALYDALVAKVDLDKAYGKILPGYTPQ